ncbi:hypothetical protein GGR56DRAFT_628339 [Xylariaceae sp. FL0804]|nr:hypothetical protein GGR56DRAFT_628339 [Xylariaceae sp. FL0804]
MNRRDQETLMDRHERIIAQILTRFRNMIVAATETLPTTNIIENAALNRMTMERETAALITEIENLLALNRQLKALWVVGPLRRPNADDDREAALDAKARRVQRLYDQVVALRSNHHHQNNHNDNDNDENSNPAASAASAAAAQSVPQQQQQQPPQP